jgi:hypothetical protein
MKTQRLAIVLTVINLVILTFNLAYSRPATAEGVAPVLRGRALEIVDDQGKVRAQIIVAPPTTMPDGQKYPETALFRLIDRNGRPEVKLGASGQGGGLGLVGATDSTQVLLKAEGMESWLKLRNKDGREQIVKP